MNVLQFHDRFKAAGFTEDQAQLLDEVLMKQFKEGETNLKTVETNLGYKIELSAAGIKALIAESNLAHARWMIGFGFVQIGLIVGLFIKLM